MKFGYLQMNVSVKYSKIFIPFTVGSVNVNPGIFGKPVIILFLKRSKTSFVEITVERSMNIDKTCFQGNLKHMTTGLPSQRSCILYFLLYGYLYNQKQLAPNNSTYGSYKIFVHNLFLIKNMLTFKKFNF